jgi:molybdopterin converting factor small subunit
MEKMGYEKQQAVQAAVAHSADEIDQLKKTVQALRDELENERAKHHEERQSIRVQSRDETKHLEEMVSALREQLEHRNGR